MKFKNLLLIFLLVVTLFGVTACSLFSNSSNFCIEFIDVGQGDAALIECDGRYMLIDGGSKTSSIDDNPVYQLLKSKGIQHIDLLVISHLHEDHYGGLIERLKYATNFDKTISNKTQVDEKTFRELESELETNGTKISVPNVGDKFELGSAEIEVIDASAENYNDSLVLMITYRKTKFLFTGDIEGEAQERISNKYKNKKYKVNLIKMPHHGDSNDSLYSFLKTFMTDYAVISVGAGNGYGHPDEETLNILSKLKKVNKIKVYRTDKDGNITVKSNGRSLKITTSK